MRARARRAWMIGLSSCLLACAAVLAFIGLRDSVTYFRSPMEIVNSGLNRTGMRVRIGGLVAVGSVVQGLSGETQFKISDGQASIAVVTRRTLPDLFAEGQGVVAEGVFGASGLLEASRVLARHDETYMPAEAYQALRRAAAAAAAAAATATESDQAR